MPPNRRSQPPRTGPGASPTSTGTVNSSRYCIPHCGNIWSVHPNTGTPWKLAQPAWSRRGSAPVGISRGYINLMEVWANILSTHLDQGATPQLTPGRFAWTATTTFAHAAHLSVWLSVWEVSPELHRQSWGPPRTAAMAIVKAFILDIRRKESTR